MAFGSVPGTTGISSVNGFAIRPSLRERDCFRRLYHNGAP